MSKQIQLDGPTEDQFRALQTYAGFDAVALAEELREGVLLLLAARPDDADYHAQVRASFDEVREKLADAEDGEFVIDALGPIAAAVKTAHS
jgi:hypothetical protein